MKSSSFFSNGHEKSWPSPPSGRRGVVLLMMIVLLLVVTIITTGMASALARHHRQMRLQQRQLQALWLAESAIERATARLRLFPHDAGETWVIPADQMAGDWAGVVEIQVTPLEGWPNRRAVSVVADYPRDLPHRIRCRKKVIVDVPNPGGPS